MRSAKDDDPGEDFDSPTEPMIRIVLAPHAPAPGPAGSGDGGLPGEPTVPLRRADPLTPAPEMPAVYPVLPPAPPAGQDSRPPGGAAPLSNGRSALPAGMTTPVQPRHSQVPVVVGVCFVAVQVLLLVRVLLVLFSVQNSFAWVISVASSIFELPFRLLFDHIQPLAQFGPDVINYVAPLTAILVYGLVSRVLVRFLKALLN